MPLEIPDDLRAALQQPVAVFGGGVSGRGAQALLQALGRPGVVYDERDRQFTGADAAGHRLVVFSPGFPMNHPWLKLAQARGLDCRGELDFAGRFWRGRLVAVTGTNGKTTLTEFLTFALRANGAPAHAAGNVGRPLSELAARLAGGTADDTAVCEVSSFQAESLRRLRPDATLWTNFAEDHLNRHTGLEGYFRAKWNLWERTAAGRALAGSSVGAWAAQFGVPLPAAALVPTWNQPADARLANSVFADYPQRENFLLAAAWWRLAGRPEAALVAAARDFRLGPHRLAPVGEHDGVTWWNDSKGTNFHAVEAALTRFVRPVLLIAGGQSKGGDLAGFVRRIGPKVRRMYLIGETQQSLAEACAAAGLAYTASADLSTAVRAAAADARPGDAVLLSPGFASFDQFDNYQHRGECFERLVHELGLTASLN